MKIEIKQGTKEWMEYRKSKRNASETPAVMGCGFISTAKLAYQKLHGGESDSPSPQMLEGIRQEPMIRQKWNDENFCNFEPCVWQSDNDERYSASLDGAEFDAKFDNNIERILEIKFSDIEFDVVETTGAPSQHYYLQVQHQLMVTGLNYADFVVGKLDDFGALVITHCVVRRDDEVIASIKQAWDEFYDDYRCRADVDVIENLLLETKKQIDKLEAKFEALKQELIKEVGEKGYVSDKLTLSKVERKPTYNYRAYCESIQADIPAEFLGSASSFWKITLGKNR